MSKGLWTGHMKLLGGCIVKASIQLHDTALARELPYNLLSMSVLDWLRAHRCLSGCTLLGRLSSRTYQSKWQCRRSYHYRMAARQAVSATRQSVSMTSDATYSFQDFHLLIAYE